MGGGGGVEPHGKTVKKRRPLFQYIPFMPYPRPEISSGEKRDCFFSTYIYCVAVQVDLEPLHSATRF